MNSVDKAAVLQKHGELYLLDDFLGVMLKIIIVDGKEEKYLKWKGRKEKRVASDNETACDIYIDSGSEQVTKEIYEKY